jgi:hypothetical protein
MPVRTIVIIAVFCFELHYVAGPYKVVAKVSLRTILYTQFKPMDGLPLFCERHQGELMGAVDVVVGSYEQAEQMVLMINKNLAAFCYYFLTYRM